MVFSSFIPVFAVFFTDILCDTAEMEKCGVICGQYFILYGR